MVHRPSDSRLLVNLLSHEKDYAKQLSTLLDSSHASLASFSAYASASAPPASQIIIEVAGALAGADEALRKYALSLEQWQEQLRSLKDLEDEVGNIMRDREILVTRLIKVSKQQKPTRDVILATSSSSSTLSVARPEVQVGTKLATAQSELQACEAHLASKEKELDVMRTAALRSGLSTRCKAMVECGWTWGEMGKEGLRALETLEAPTSNANGNGYAHPLPSPPSYVRPPINGTANGHADGQPSSDLSSIGPSQSASQNTHVDGLTTRPSLSYTLNIPPAHSISDHTFPSYYGQESESGGGSSAEEGEGQYEVRNNPRFSTGAKGKAKTVSAVSSPDKRMRSPSPSPKQSPKTRQRRGSTSVFGSIAAFFHHNRGSSVDGGRDRDADYDSSPTRSQSRWQTRTDKNLLRRRDSDDDILPTSYSLTMPPSVITDSPNIQDSSRPLRQQQPQGRLKKRGTTKKGTASVTSAPQAKVRADDKGWVSDGAAARPNTGSVRSKKAKTAKEPADLSPISPITPSSQTTIKASDFKPKEKSDSTRGTDTGHDAAESPIPEQGTLKGKKPGNKLPATLPTEVTISRNSSLSKHSVLSAASAPVGIESQPNAALYRATPLKHSASTSHKRSVSLDSGGPGRAAGSARGGKKASSPARNGTARANGSNGQSLMSIVEGVSKQNWEHRSPHDPTSMLFFAKAPPSIGANIDAELHALENTPVTLPGQTAHPSEASPGVAREASEGSVPLTPSIPSQEPPKLHVPSPQLKPLRSALRNPSRSPSPNASIALPPASLPPPAIPARSKLRPSPTQPPQELPPVQTDLSMNGKAEKEVDDVSSISSYETTREMLDDESFNTPPQASPLPSPPSPSSPAPAVPPKVINGQPTVAPAPGSDISQSTSTASNSTQPTRRKSVRMSLPPTFSTTPPAFDDDTDGSRHAPWAMPREQPVNGWSSRIRDPTERDMWQDSSEDEEDEEYALAKKLLSRTPKKKKRA